MQQPVGFLSDFSVNIYHYVRPLRQSRLVERSGVLNGRKRSQGMVPKFPMTGWGWGQGAVSRSGGFQGGADPYLITSDVRREVYDTPLPSPSWRATRTPRGSSSIQRRPFLFES